eukprot:tig00021612_g22903.t1
MPSTEQTPDKLIPKFEDCACNGQQQLYVNENGAGNEMSFVTAEPLIVAINHVNAGHHHVPWEMYQRETPDLPPQIRDIVSHDVPESDEPDSYSGPMLGYLPRQELDADVPAVYEAEPVAELVPDEEGVDAAVRGAGPGADGLISYSAAGYVASAEASEGVESAPIAAGDVVCTADVQEEAADEPVDLP